MNVTSATFDTTTGMLSLLNSTGTDLDDIHFAGDASGLQLSAQPGFGGSGPYLAINDQDTSGNGVGGNIPLTFHV